MGQAKRKLEDSTVPTSVMNQIGPIEALQCPHCHTIYPKQEGILDTKRCVAGAILGGCSDTGTKPIKVTIHYGEGGAF